MNTPHLLVTDTELAFLLGGSPDSRYGKVKRLIAQGRLLHIRRGLYSWAKEPGSEVMLHPFELAQRIYAPSYISLESALAYRQLIPEAVYAMTSVSTKRTKEFDTPLGKFSYMHLPVENFYLNVELVKTDNYQFFMAKPWKAICDYIYCYRKEWRNIDPLVQSLRINMDELPLFSDAEKIALDNYYHNRRVTRFLNGIKQ